MDSTRAFGRNHGEPQLAQYAVLTGMKLEDCAESFNIELEAAVQLEGLAFGCAVPVQDSDFRIACSINNGVSMLALRLDMEYQESQDLAAKIGRVILELDRLAQKCGTDLRQTMRAGREAAHMLFSEYRCPST